MNEWPCGAARRGPSPSGYALLLAALAGWGCTVSALPESEPSIALNECESNGDCGDGQCLDEMCVASTGTLSRLLFEVVPAASAGKLAGASLFALPDDVPTSSVDDFDLFLADPAGVTVSLRTEPPLDELLVQREMAFPSPPLECNNFFVGDTEGNNLSPVAGKIPVRVTYVPAERELGLAAPTRVVHADEINDDDVMSSFEFVTPLSPGFYDIYAEPRAASEDERCSLPPQLWRNVLLPGETRLGLRLGRPRELRIEVVLPADSGDALTSWKVDMIEPRSARPVSTRLSLSVPSCDDTLGECVYKTVLSYLPVVGGSDDEGSELVRLTPPADVTAPTILLQRSALELFAPGSGTIDLSEGLPSPVVVEGQTIAGPTGEPLGAMLAVRATELEGIPVGTFAAFERQVQADDEGRFELELLPGKYRVSAMPTRDAEGGLGLATVEALWDVAAEPARQAGRLIELPDAHSQRGGATISGSGDGVRGAVVNVEASGAVPELRVLDRALGLEPAAPRAAAVTIDNDGGRFTLLSDFGVFDLSVRPAAASRLAWLVMPGITFKRDVQPPALSLPLPLPIRIRANVWLGAEPSSPTLAGAYLRAYALVDDSSALVTELAEARSVVPVAEGRLDKNARVTLYVPASLNLPPEEMVP